VVAAGAKKDGELSTSECLTLIDQMPEIGVSSVTFSGGEPLIRADLFQLAQHVRCRGMTAALSSNGTLIDATAAGRMASLGMDVQISIDGSTAAVHDGFRGRPGAFDETLRGAENLRRAGVQFTVGSVLHRSNLFQVGDLLKLSVALGANAFRLIPFITAGRGNSSRHLEPTPQELRAATEYLRDRRQSSPVTITPMEFEFSFAPGCHTAVDSSAQIGCDGARSTFSISATGEVLPCSFFTGARADNVRDRPLAWIWNDSPLLNYVRDMRAVDIHGVCHQCSWFARCLGGCPSANLSRGKMLEPNVRCWVAEELAAAGRTGQ
jgi:radical SAM protein with 4Fe4S-binding SPASM domain